MGGRRRSRGVERWKGVFQELGGSGGLSSAWQDRVGKGWAHWSAPAVVSLEKLGKMKTQPHLYLN